MSKIRKFLIVCISILLMITVALGIAINLPQFARVKGTIMSLVKDGHFVSNAIDYWNNRQDRIRQEEHNEKQKQEFIKQREAERENLNKNANARNYLKTPTYDFSGQAAHPDILYFDNGFNGYKYWMAFTPYPNSQKEIENPSILVSNDGVNWDIPYKLSNPIVPTPDDVLDGGHNSDTDMIYVDGKLIVYYVYNKDGVRGPSRFYRVESIDGVTWSKPELVFKTDRSIEGYSPAIIYKKDSYKMWYFGGENNLLYVTSRDGRKWDGIIPINSFKIDNWRPWHIDVIETDSGYEALICSRKDKSTTRALFYGSSKDGFKWDIDNTPVLYPSDDSWDSQSIYRSTFIKQDGLYKVWYSAYDRNEKWHIGYVEGKDITKLTGMGSFAGN